ncbi:methylenetetrahydrofolate dehydrogenase [candidate division SR1 bacterium RAAC1_SR1_1]|nr:methylenetetrahydrofolate dehydrogenase [candidate division SR1 bacterium RAAC1_SR1_1]
MILRGKELSVKMQENLKLKAKTLSDNSYMAILFFGNDFSSGTYVRHKQKYGESIGVPVKIFTEEGFSPLVQEKESFANRVFNLIHQLNHDSFCIGIIIQLPLPEELKGHQNELLSTISPEKDIDGLGGVNTGLSSTGLIDFIPATPKAVITLLEEYKLDNLKGKKVAIIGQSNIVGKPLIMECIKRGAIVSSFNIDYTPEEIKQFTQKSDYIIACTGQVHLVDDSRIRHDQSQIIIDVGYGHIDGKPVGDVNIESIADKVFAYTPVPGGIGPLTVACLFDNIFTLQGYKKILEKYRG